MDLIVLTKYMYIKDILGIQTLLAICDLFYFIYSNLFIPTFYVLLLSVTTLQVREGVSFLYL